MDNLLISKLLPREKISKVVKEVKKIYGNGKFSTLTQEKEVIDTIQYLWVELFLDFYNEHSFFMWLLYEYSFVNTNEISARGNDYLKNNSYVNGISKDNEILFWKRETIYRKYGKVFKCLIKKGDSITPDNLIPFWIPGKYYGFLNYGLMTRSYSDALDLKEKAANMSKNELSKMSSASKLKLLYAKHQTRLSAKPVSSLPDFWDIHLKYFFFKNIGNNLTLGMATAKARRKGLSIVSAWSVFDNYDLIAKSTSAVIAEKESYLNEPNDGIFTFAKKYSNHINDTTTWKKNRVIDNSLEMLSGYMLKGTKELKGFASSIVAIVGSDPDKLRGKKFYEVQMEEMGTFPSARSIYNIGKSSAESGNLVVGTYDFLGTVGSKDEDMEFFREIFYNPKSFECMPFINVYDPPNIRDNEICGFFVGQLECLEGGGMDKWGNSDYEKAMIIHERNKELNKKKLNTGDYNTWIRERALTSIDAFGTSGASYFISESLKMHYNKVIASKSQLITEILQPTYGWLEESKIKKDNSLNNDLTSIFNKVEHFNVDFLTSDQYEIKYKKRLIPITSNTIMKENQLQGAVTIWEQPKKINNVVPEGLYDIVYDTMGTDKVEKTYRDSMAAIFVFRRNRPQYGSSHEMLVASYVGRLDSMAEVDRMAYKLSIYYNCKILVEVNKGETGSNFKSWHAFDKLYPRFSTLDNQIVVGQPNMIGVYMTSELKNLCIGYLKSLLYTEVDRDSEGNTIYWFQKAIHCPFTLQQIAAFKDGGNYDAVSALLIFMVLRSAETSMVSKSKKAASIFEYFSNKLK